MKFIDSSQHWFLSGILHGLPLGFLGGIAFVAWTMRSSSPQPVWPFLFAFVGISCLPAALFDATVAIGHARRRFRAAADNQPKFD